MSEHLIEELHIQKAFLSCSGFSLESGLTEVHLAEAQPLPEGPRGGVLVEQIEARVAGVVILGAALLTTRMRWFTASGSKGAPA